MKSSANFQWDVSPGASGPNKIKTLLRFETKMSNFQDPISSESFHKLKTGLKMKNMIIKNQYMMEPTNPPPWIVL